MKFLLQVIAVLTITQLPSGEELIKEAFPNGHITRYHGASKNLWERAVVVIAAVDEKTTKADSQNLFLRPIASLAGNIDPTSTKEMQVYFYHDKDKVVLKDAQRNAFVIALLHKVGNRFVVPNQQSSIDFFGKHAERGTMIWMPSLDTGIIGELSSRLSSLRAGE